MKKMYLLCAFMLTAMSAGAQEVTQQELQGNWTMSYFKDENGTANVAEGTWKVNDKPTVAKEQVEEQYEFIIQQAKGAVLKIEGAAISQVVMGEEHKAELKLENKDGKTYMIVDEQGRQDRPQVFIDKGQLHVIDSEIKAELVYVRAK
ncbi:MAG: hypothetical protein EOP51_21310 [Sphingobacteriales bacterium]|nr:MAG: hypothetical protein EOP51_21310 [Sphingobacteriales bacterium]